MLLNKISSIQESIFPKLTNRTRNQLVGSDDTMRQTGKKNNIEPMRTAEVMKCLVREKAVIVV